MTLAELMHYLDANTGYDVLDGSPDETLAKAKAGTHRDPLLAEIIVAFAAQGGCDSADAPVERAGMVNAMGPIRLKYMGDDAPIDAFRAVQRLVVAIDEAFDEEALRGRGK